MGANRTQAVAVLLLLIGFVLLAGAFAGGGVIAWVGALALVGASVFLFMKCKPWEHQND